MPGADAVAVHGFGCRRTRHRPQQREERGSVGLEPVSKHATKQASNPVGRMRVGGVTVDEGAPGDGVAYVGHFVEYLAGTGDVATGGVEVEEGVPEVEEGVVRSAEG